MSKNSVGISSIVTLGGYWENIGCSDGISDRLPKWKLLEEFQTRSENFV
jgi:hypothetical protein